MGLTPETLVDLDLLLQTASHEACLDFCARSPVLFAAIMHKASCLPRPPKTQAPLELREAWFRCGAESAKHYLETLNHLLPPRPLDPWREQAIQALQYQGEQLLHHLAFQLGQGAHSMIKLLALLLMHPSFEPHGTKAEWILLMNPFIRHLHPLLRESFLRIAEVDLAVDQSVQCLSDFSSLLLHLALDLQLPEESVALVGRLDLQTWQLEALQEQRHV